MSRKKRKAWLITWESTREDYMTHLGRPEVVAILSPRLSEKIIQTILHALYCSESVLTLFEKLNYGLASLKAPALNFRSYHGELSLGINPFLIARRVTDLYIVRNSPTEQTLHCRTEPQSDHDNETLAPKLVLPESPLSYTCREAFNPT